MFPFIGAFITARVTILASSSRRTGGLAMTGDLNRAFHRETVLGFGVGDERIVRQREGSALYAGIRVEVRSLNRGKGASFA